jgi:NitT/TauT family transport system ATP-binding protein
MQQRVALCRLLIAEPSLLLLDEPFGALDEFTRERLNLELAAITEQQHKSVVLVTHNVAEAAFLSDRIFVMGADPGRMLGVVDVDLPRPRRSELLASDAHSRIVREVRTMLGIS